MLLLPAHIVLLVLVHRQRHATAAPGKGNRWWRAMVAGRTAILAVVLGISPVRGLLALATPDPATVVATALVMLALLCWLALLPAMVLGLRRAWSLRRSARLDHNHARS
ncbi:MAG TPA: hypothetical protein VGU03_10485 [Frateuria sp.]|uniref:hypothetical protein n=1 Tax=Frateuria sp. TaxID=2211372 RepID=UPI002DF21069|nr:hypothetical protein [Frateuria sp.]